MIWPRGQAEGGNMEQFQADSWIGGRSVASSGDPIPVIDPGTGAQIGLAARGGSAEVDHAVAEATKAFHADSWRRVDPHIRGRLMWQLARDVAAHRDRLAMMLSLENGKPLRNSHAEIQTVVRYFEYYAGWADKAGGRLVPVPGNAFSYVQHEPLGVVAHIIPWNYPVDIFARGVAPCLAVGNTVVVKPDEHTPLTTFEIAKLAKDAGFPDGVINIVNGTGEEAGVALANHPGIQALAFCGSISAGKSVLRAAAERIIPVVSLELGGKSAQIVLPGADLKRAAGGAGGGICYNTGQSCGARSRLLVHESVAEEAAELVARAMSGVTVGYGPEDPDMGPLSSREQLESVMRFVEAGKSEGAILREGGTAAVVEGRDGYYIRPTLFTGARTGMRIIEEEIFGPVLAMQTFASEEEAIALANDSPYGISAEVWSPDISSAHRVINALDVSHVSVNGTGGFGIEVPFGGVKNSGIGREGGWEGVLQYSRVKSVWINTD
ncbi:MAG: aldehyde dehydrogenase family protein [Spirochaetales bacterium]|nr:MAG: aldehyde dehydrogenase family protein [Spirochaetales bacterium]